MQVTSAPSDGDFSQTMKKLEIVATLVLSIILQVSAAAQSKPIVGYKIDARLTLDDQKRPSAIDGREELSWLNSSPDTISELQFHLYLNAFKNEKSTFSRESGGQLRGDRFAPGEWGWIDVSSIKTSSGEDLTSKMEFIRPDDGNADDQTVFRLPLSKPLKPNETITLDIEFKSRLPRVFARTGYWKSFAMVGQWFPKIGVWESKGQRRRETAGWNCHQFHANSEFYADFGSFDVTLTVPSVYKGKIGATGVMRSEKSNSDGTVSVNYFQQDVHDFAWTVDSNYIKTVRPFSQATGTVNVTLLIQPEHEGQTDRHYTAAFNALKYFGEWYGFYPYSTLTVVDPPYNADGAGGMEYPTLITAGTHWRAGRDQNPEGVVVHEAGHQFWYGLVASNEFEEAWLDEGFNTYSTGKVLEKCYGRDVVPFRSRGINWFYFPFEIPHPYEDRIGTLQGSFFDPIIRSSWQYATSNSYGLNVYPRTGLTLRTLEGYVGEDRMRQIMRTYAERWRFRHPTSQDFIDVANEVSANDLNWFFDQFVKGTSTLDYRITDVESVRRGAETGMFDESGKRVEVTEEQVEPKAGQESEYESEITVQRLGEAWFPVELRVTLKDGTVFAFEPGAIHDGIIDYNIRNPQSGATKTDSWPISERWKKFRITGKAEVAHAVIDPRRRVLLDANLTNNGWSHASGLKGAIRWSGGALFWVQSLCSALGLLS